MKKNYRIVSLLLACVFFVSVLASCSGGETPEDTTSADTTTAPVPDNWPEVEGTVIYVDASAEDGGDGSKTTPYKSISEAQARIREIKSGEGLPEGGITVLVASGEYSIKDGIKFTEEDSGTETAPIKYMSAEKGGAVLNGGVTLNASDFEPLSDDEKAILNDATAKEAVRKIDLTKYGLTSEDLGELHQYGFSSKKPSSGRGYSELFINSERMTISRYPNANAEDPNLYTGSGDGVANFDILTTGEHEAPSLAIKERGVNWNIDELWAFGYFYYGWSDAAVRVADLDTNSLNVILAQNVTFGICEEQNFYFFNILAETDLPGEYYIDRKNAVLYLYPTEDFENSSISISVIDETIVSGLNISYITLDGFEITGSRTNGIVVYGDNVTIDNCLIRDVRYNAVEITGSNIVVKNSELCQIGDAGIIAGGGNAETLTSSGILIYNNYIHHWGQVGRTYESAVELNGCGITVSHNEMHDAPHQAITWDGPNHVMEYNNIYNVCLETDDCGAIYTGRRYDWYGGVIRYNYIHDVGSDTAGAHGIYLDDALSGQTVYGNVIANITGHGIVLAGGRDNVIENNLIINCVGNSISFDIRAREAMMNGVGDWFYDITLTMSEQLKQAQTRPAWLEYFPGYGDIIPYTADYAGDIYDPMVSCNPSNNIVRKNVHYTVDLKNNKGFLLNYVVFINMSTIEENYDFIDLECAQIPGYSSGDCTLTDDAVAYQYGFEKLPFDEMGRIDS
ncbi:MAG: right-handed parallel beta-helix repeat-containing protein [Clostridia bacterium]|nr:right-handed parallel beta-helix repeat-containing protein [Clostridia bacterium]